MHAHVGRFRWHCHLWFWWASNYAFAGRNKGACNPIQTSENQLGFQSSFRNCPLERAPSLDKSLHSVNRTIPEPIWEATSHLLHTAEWRCTPIQRLVFVARQQFWRCWQEWPGLPSGTSGDWPACHFWELHSASVGSFYMRNGHCSHPISLLGFGWSEQVSVKIQGSKLKCKYMLVGSDIYH